MQGAYDLVVDTSRKGIAMGLYPRDLSADKAFERVEPAARGEMLDSLLSQLLIDADLSLSSVQRVLVTLGPGSFTGLRTGIAFCEGLCITGERTLHGVSTLRALTTLLPRTTEDQWPENAAVVYRARPGYWYVGVAAGEFFIDTPQATRLLEQSHHVLADAAAWGDPAFAGLERSGWVLDNGTTIAPFVSLLNGISASPSQKANYIQDSYFEKKQER